MRQAALMLAGDEMAEAVDAIHLGTAIYTAAPEIETLLDHLGWPTQGSRLLDPGAGNGGFVVAALARLDLARDDLRTAVTRVHGYEFHPAACDSARRAVEAHLRNRGWNRDCARRTSELVIERTDFLLNEVPKGVWDVIAANPPYWRYANLPEAYRPAFDAAVAHHARADLLYAYLQRAADVIAVNGRMGLVTADRWLLNSGSASLRSLLGSTWTIAHASRLDTRSAFYRPKAKGRGTPARVHPVSLVLVSDGTGRVLEAEPFRIDAVPEVDGPLLGDLVTIRLAPWLGPDGIFLLDDPGGLPKEHLVPCFRPEDISEGRRAEPGAWAILTGHEEPPAEVLRHLDERLHLMPKRGRQRIRWLPPETFHGRLPLQHDALIIPRISRSLRTVRLPAGTMPVNHNLVVASGSDPSRLQEVLADPRVTAQADALALPLESGYRSYTTTLLRSLRVPRELASCL
jgi:hypothetical protein